MMDIIGIAKAVEEVSGLSLEEIKRKDRRRKVVMARHSLMYVARMNMDISLMAIARFLGVDHTTVINGINRMQCMIETNDEPYVRFLSDVRKRSYELCDNPTKVFVVVPGHKDPKKIIEFLVKEYGCQCRIEKF
jgi:hypothetical protein